VGKLQCAFEHKYKHKRREIEAHIHANTQTNRQRSIAGSMWHGPLSIRAVYAASDSAIAHASHSAD